MPKHRTDFSQYNFPRRLQLLASTADRAVYKLELRLKSDQVSEAERRRIIHDKRYLLQRRNRLFDWSLHAWSKASYRNDYLQTGRELYKFVGYLMALSNPTVKERLRFELLHGPSTQLTRHNAAVNRYESADCRNAKKKPEGYRPFANLGAMLNGLRKPKTGTKTGPDLKGDVGASAHAGNPS